MEYIPSELLETGFSEYDVNVIIGENGSGKSVALNNIAKSLTRRGQNVIAIATSVHDKFTNRSKYFSFYGGRQGRNRVSNIVKKALLHSDYDEIDRINLLINVLEYVGYDTQIGVKIGGFDPQKIPIIERDDTIKEEEKHDVLYLLRKYQEVFERGGIVSIVLQSVSRGKIHSSAFGSILKHENFLKKNKVIKSLNIFLVKDGQDIKLQYASSGELMLISTLMFIATSIVKDSTILVDEPESSLHPKWQREYIKKILDLFYYHHPKIIIATHSSLIIPHGEDLSNLYVIKNNYLEKTKKKLANNEEILSEAFGVVTPENRYLSDHIVEILNSYDSQNISYDSAVTQIESYKDKINDTRQLEFLNGVLGIVEKVRIQKVK